MCAFKLVEVITNVWLAAVEQPSFGSFPRAAVALNFFFCAVLP
jgi:hypothetical protein